MPGEVEKVRQVPRRGFGVPRIRQLGVGVPKFIEERMAHCFDRRQTLCGRVFQ